MVHIWFAGIWPESFWECIGYLVIVLVIATLSILAYRKLHNWWEYRQGKKIFMGTGLPPETINSDSHTTYKRSPEETRDFKRIFSILESIEPDIKETNKRLTEIETVLREIQSEMRDIADGNKTYFVSNSEPPKKSSSYNASTNPKYIQQNSWPTTPKEGKRSSGHLNADDRDLLNSAMQSYRKLDSEGLRGLPIEPLFAVLDIDSSNQASVGDTYCYFKQSESKQSAFVIFPNKDATEGWLFPNPKISFTEAMKYVFPELSYDRFEELKNRVEPVCVRSLTNDVWEKYS